MSDVWPLARLGDLVELHDTARVPVRADVRRAGPYPYCGANGIVDYVDGFRYDGSYVLVAEDGGYWGRNEPSAYSMRGKFWVNNHAHVLRVRDGVDERFLLHALNFLDMRPWVTGTTRGKLNAAALKGVMVPLPPLIEQQRIGDLLDSQQEELSARQRQLDELDNLLLAAADDVVTRAAADTPAVALGSVASVERGYTWKKTDECPVKAPGTMPVVRIGNVQRTGIDMDDCLWIANVDRQKATGKVLEPDTILVVGSNGNPERIGNAYLAGQELEGHLYASFLMGITPREIPARFIWRVLQSPRVQRQITKATSGSTGLMNISLTWMRSLKVPCPTREECEKLIGPVEAIDEARSAAGLALSAARELQRTLRTALLSTDVRLQASYDRFLVASENESADEPDLVSA